jgi:hypothetical protein
MELLMEHAEPAELHQHVPLDTHANLISLVSSTNVLQTLNARLPSNIATLTPDSARQKLAQLKPR